MISDVIPVIASVVLGAVSLGGAFGGYAGSLAGLTFGFFLSIIIIQFERNITRKRC